MHFRYVTLMFRMSLLSGLLTPALSLAESELSLLEHGMTVRPATATRATARTAEKAGLELFSNVGIDPLTRKIVVVKATNHFMAASRRSPGGSST